MPDYLRLRQICLAAPRLEPLVTDIQEIFGVQVCHRDGNVAKYGLRNVLFPIGTNFLEIVSPQEPNTAAGRFIEKTKGHGGYMTCFQANDVRRRQAHALKMGVRVPNALDRTDYHNAQLHPRDCRASFIEFGDSPGGEDRMGAWAPVGEVWQDFVKTDVTRRMLGTEVESPDPAGLAAHWSNIIEVPLTLDRNDPILTFEDGTIRFVKGETESLSAVVLEVSDPRTVLARAVQCGYRVQNDSFHLGGVYFRVHSAT